MAISVKSMRLDDEVVEMFSNFVKKNEFENQNSALQALLKIAEVESSKSVFGDRKSEIEDFQTHTQALLEAFMHSLQINANSEERVRKDFAKQLDSQLDTINELREKLKSTVEETEKIILESKNEVEKAVQEKNQAVEKVENLSRSNLELVENNKSLEKNLEIVSNSLDIAQDKLKELDIKAKLYNEIVVVVDQLKKDCSAVEKEKTDLESQYKLELKQLEIDKNNEISKIKTEKQEEIFKLSTEINTQKLNFEHEKQEIIQKMNSNFKIEKENEVKTLKEEYEKRLEVQKIDFEERLKELKIELNQLKNQPKQPKNSAKTKEVK